MSHFFNDFSNTIGKEDTGAKQVNAGEAQGNTGVSSEDLENMKNAFIEEITALKNEIAALSSINKEVTKGTNKDEIPNTQEKIEQEEN